MNYQKVLKKHKRLETIEQVHKPVVQAAILLITLDTECSFNTEREDQ